LILAVVLVVIGALTMLGTVGWWVDASASRSEERAEDVAADL
jgi:Flp pilus assembly protein TadB